MGVIILTSLGVTLAVAALTVEYVRTLPVRRSLRTFVAIVDAADRQDVAAVRSLCSARYLAGHPLDPAPEGGVVGFPRGIHQNFQAWRAEGHVLVCPGNRVGPVYRVIPEQGEWRFDGPAGLLRATGEVVPVAEDGVGK